MEPCDLALDIAVGRGLDAAIDSALEIGPAAARWTSQPAGGARRRRRSRSARRCAARQGTAVPLGAAIWIVTARKPPEALREKSELLNEFNLIPPVQSCSKK